nr:hypothetical protein [uncultured Porphyromonas sp.]
MKNLILMLAVLGLLSACAQESGEPQLQQTPQEQLERSPLITATDSDAPGAIRFRLSADIEPFQLATTRYAEGPRQASRAVETTVSGSEVKHSIDYRLNPEKDGMVPALMHVYDSEGSIRIQTRVKVTKLGKGVEHFFAVQPQAGTPEAETLQRMVRNKMQGAKIAFIIGYDKGTEGTFTNKGAQRIRYTGRPAKLPEDFILLKATDIPLELHGLGDRPSEVRVVDGASIVLRMQGYLLGVRFDNGFPLQVRRHAWRQQQEAPYPVTASGTKATSTAEEQLRFRPALQLRLRLSNLSATYQTQLAFDPKVGDYTASPELNDPSQLGRRRLSPRLTRLEGEHEGGREDDFFDSGSTGLLTVFAGNGGDPSHFSEGEQFVLLYCPNPRDTGAVAYYPIHKRYYDGSPFSSLRDAEGKIRYYALRNRSNVIRKRRDTPMSDVKGKRDLEQSADGRIFFVTFRLLQDEGSLQPNEHWSKETNPKLYQH